MCTVQVLLFADVMGRSNGIQGVRSGGARVCRKLFGNDPSAGQADPSAFLRRMEEQLRRRDQERWNFDFQTETPLPGRYQWVPVGRRAPAPPKEVEVVEEVRPETSSSSMPASRNRRTVSTVQSKITDFMRGKKRHLSEDEASSSKRLKLRRLNSSSNATQTTTTRLR